MLRETHLEEGGHQAKQLQRDTAFVSACDPQARAKAQASLEPALKNYRCAHASTPPCRTPMIWSRDSFADAFLQKSLYPPTQQRDADTRSRRPNRRPPSCPDRTSPQLKTTNRLTLGRDAGTPRHVCRTTLTPLQQHAKASSLQQSSTSPHNEKAKSDPPKGIHRRHLRAIRKMEERKAGVDRLWKCCWEPVRSRDTIE